MLQQTSLFSGAVNFMWFRLGQLKIRVLEKEFEEALG
jgi:hypothetical protein